MGVSFLELGGRFSAPHVVDEESIAPRQEEPGVRKNGDHVKLFTTAIGPSARWEKLISVQVEEPLMNGWQEVSERLGWRFANL